MTRTSRDPRSRRLHAAALLIGVVILAAVGSVGDGEPVAIPQCAHVCIHHCCGLLGVPVSLKAICDKLPYSKEGHSLQQMIDVLAWIGLETRGVETSVENLSKGPFPVIAHFPDHFVVVERIAEDTVKFMDGCGRLRLVTKADFGALWDGKALYVRRPEPGRLLPAFMGVSNPAQPSIVFDSLIGDCGEVEVMEGKTVSFRFPLRNRGKAPLEIGRVRADCSCAVTGKPEVAIQEGGSGKIVVDYRAGKGSGSFSHTVYVEANDPVFPIIPLTICGSVNRKIEVNPMRIDFGDVVAGGQRSKRVLVSYTGNAVFRAISVEKDNESVRVSIPDSERERLEKLNVIPFDISYDASGHNLGRVRGRIRVRTNIEAYSAVEIPYVAQIVPEAVAVPSVCFLGDLRGKTSAEGTVRISLRDHTPFEIVGVRSTVDGLDVRYPNAECDEAVVSFGRVPKVGGNWATARPCLAAHS